LTRTSHLPNEVSAFALHRLPPETVGDCQRVAAAPASLLADSKDVVQRSQQLLPHLLLPPHRRRAMRVSSMRLSPVSPAMQSLGTLAVQHVAPPNAGKTAIASGSARPSPPPASTAVSWATRLAMAWRRAWGAQTGLRVWWSPRAHPRPGAQSPARSRHRASSCGRRWRRAPRGRR